MLANLTEYGSLIGLIAVAGGILTLLLRFCMSGLAGGDGWSWIAAIMVGLMPAMICLLGVLGANDPLIPIATTSMAARIVDKLIVASVLCEILAMIVAGRIVLGAELDWLALRAAGAIISSVATLILTAIALLAAGQLVAGVSL